MTTYDKAIEVYFLLHQIEQLIINDQTFAHVQRDVSSCLIRVENIQHDIEASGQ